MAKLWVALCGKGRREARLKCEANEILHVAADLWADIAAAIPRLTPIASYQSVRLGGIDRGVKDCRKRVGMKVR
jgi:hypothetical protein